MVAKHQTTMKTLLPILLFVILIGSCKKEPCYICRTETFSKYDDHRISIDSEVICGSELEMLSYQTDHFNFDDPATYTTCECEKQ